MTQIAETLAVVLIAVAVCGGIWIVANLVFDQVRHDWSRFSLLAFGISGFFFAMLISGNRATRYSGPADTTIERFGYWVWLPLVVGVGSAIVGFFMGRVTDRMTRLGIGIGGLGGLGALVGSMLREVYFPDLEPVPVVVWPLIGLVVGGGMSLFQRRPPIGGALIGAAVGWIIGAWGMPDLGNDGTLPWAIIAMAVPPALIGARVAIAEIPSVRERSLIDQRSRAFVFLAPALLFIFATLVVPTIRTIYLSIYDRDTEAYVGLGNYRDIFNDVNSWDLSGWSDVFTSRLFWIGIFLLIAFVLLGIRGKTQTGKVVEFGSASMGPLLIGGLLILFAFFTTSRGTILNNLWWVVVVTAFSTAMGLAVAVLADNAPGEKVAKSLIFMPMAISLVGASVIWRFMYVARDTSQAQTGTMNSLWVDLGKLSTGQKIGVSGMVILLGLIAIALVLNFYGKRNWIGVGATVVAAPIVILAVTALWSQASGTVLRIILGVLFTLLFIGLVAFSVQAIGRREYSRVVAPAVLVIMSGWFLARYWQIWGDGVGGQRVNTAGSLVAGPINFIQDGPFNNMWLMVVLIWIQTGFAMVILSAAIKAVPIEFLEAARVDGATDGQIFWRVTLPQIITTIGVVVTTLIVLVMKVYDIVQVLTNGNFGTEVLANAMYREAFLNLNRGFGAALAVLIFISVLPIMVLNIRRMQREA